MFTRIWRRQGASKHLPGAAPVAIPTDTDFPRITARDIEADLAYGRDDDDVAGTPRPAAPVATPC